MATINYTTLQLPKILWDYSELIQDTPHFEVRRYKYKKGIIFRIPKGAEEGKTFHAFMEHEINMSNTLRTGTLTMKVQITFIPCYMGVFSGFKELNGSYTSNWDDEDFEYDYFKPDYGSEDNVKNIIPLPPNMKTNLYEYLNEILFNHVEDSEIISKYAVDLGCKSDKINSCLVPMPVQTSDTKHGVMKYHETIDFFNEIASGSGNNLLPTSLSNCNKSSNNH